MAHWVLTKTPTGVLMTNWIVLTKLYTKVCLVIVHVFYFS